MAIYEVVGTREVLGHKPGEVFEETISPIQEARLVAGGHIARIQSALEETPQFTLVVNDDPNEVDDPEIDDEDTNADLADAA